MLEKGIVFWCNNARNTYKRIQMCQILVMVKVIAKTKTKKWKIGSISVPILNPQGTRRFALSTSQTKLMYTAPFDDLIDNSCNRLEQRWFMDDMQVFLLSITCDRNQATGDRI